MMVSDLFKASTLFSLQQQKKKKKKKLNKTPQKRPSFNEIFTLISCPLKTIVPRVGVIIDSLHIRFGQLRQEKTSEPLWSCLQSDAMTQIQDTINDPDDGSPL